MNLKNFGILGTFAGIGLKSWRIMFIKKKKNKLKWNGRRTFD